MARSVMTDEICKSVTLGVALGGAVGIVAAMIFELSQPAHLFFCLWGAGAGGGILGLLLELARVGRRRIPAGRSFPSPGKIAARRWWFLVTLCCLW